MEEAELLGRRVLTRSGAARALCVSLDKLDRMTNARELRCIRHPTLGRCYRPEDLETWLESVTGGGPKPPKQTRRRSQDDE